MIRMCLILLILFIFVLPLPQVIAQENLALSGTWYGHVEESPQSSDAVLGGLRYEHKGNLPVDLSTVL